MWCVVAAFVALITELQGVKFLIVTHDGVRLYSVAGTFQELVLLKDMVKDVDFHHSRNEVYALTFRQIIRTSLEGQPTQVYEPLVDPEDEYRLTSLAVDWVHDRLYWTSGAVLVLYGAELNGSNSQVILRCCYIEEHLNKLMVDPYVGLLFWMSNNQLHSCSLQGKNYRKNILPDLGSVRNVAIDASIGRLYVLSSWGGGGKWHVVSSDYNGKGLVVHADSPRVMYGLGAHDDYVYWAPHEENSTVEAGVGKRGYPLYGVSTVPGSSSNPDKVLILSEPIWNLKVCHPDLQKPGSTISTKVY